MVPLFRPRNPTYVCPISGARIRDAVYLGCREKPHPSYYVYEKERLVEWATFHGWKGVPMASGETLDLSLGDLKPIELPTVKEAPMAICRLGAIFNVLDSVQADLEELGSSFEPRDFEPPRVIVVGPEDMGKSSLLNRLCGLPLFPHDDGPCTTMPILVRLRRCKHGEARTSMAIRAADGRLVFEMKLVPVVLVQKEVLKAMNKHEAHRMSYTVVLDVQHPGVPRLDLMDLPGLCVNTTQEREATRRLVEMQLRQANQHSVFLFTQRAIDKFTINPAAELLTWLNKMPMSVGVFTCCDLAVSDGFKEYVQIIKSLVTGGQPAHSSAPAVGKGWVATMTTVGPKGTTSSQAPDAISLIAEYNANEARTFKATKRLFGPPELNGVDALIKKLQAMYDEAMRTSWKPHVMELLLKAMDKCEKDLKALGDPEHPSYDEIYHEMEKHISERDAVQRRVDAVVKYLNERFDEAAPFGQLLRNSSYLAIPDFADWEEFAGKELSKLLVAVLGPKDHTTGPAFVHTMVDLAWACVVDSASKSPFRMDRFKLYLESCKRELHKAAENARCEELSRKLNDYVDMTISPTTSRDIVFTTTGATINIGQIRTTIITTVLAFLPGVGSKALLEVCETQWEPNAEVFRNEACAGARKEIKNRLAALHHAAEKIERDLPSE